MLTAVVGFFGRADVDAVLELALLNHQVRDEAYT